MGRLVECLIESAVWDCEICGMKSSKNYCRGEVGESLSDSINTVGIFDYVAVNITVAVVVVVIVDIIRQRADEHYSVQHIPGIPGSI